MEARSLLPVRIMSSAARTPMRRGKPLAAAGTRDEAELHLGKPELSLGMVGGNPIVAGERQLESAAETGTVDGGDDRLVGGLDPAYRLLSLEAQPLSRVLTGEGGELLDICAGDEVVGLSRDQNDARGCWHHRAAESASASSSTLTAAVSLLTGSPGKSKVMTAMPFSFWVVKADMVVAVAQSLSRRS